MSDLTVQTCENHIRHALGGPLHALVPVVDVVNMAGEWIVNVRPWNWLRGLSTTISTTADQEYVDLPSDFGRLQKLTASSSTWNPVETTFDEIDLLRGQNVTGGAVTHFCVGYRAGPPPISVIELYPTPTDVQDYILRYSRGWVDVDDEADPIDIPTWLRMEFLEACRQIALGFEEHDVASIVERLAVIEASPTMQLKMQKDAALQPNLGPMRGGGAQQAGRVQFPYYDTIEGPS